MTCLFHWPRMCLSIGIGIGMWLGIGIGIGIGIGMWLGIGISGTGHAFVSVWGKLNFAFDFSSPPSITCMYYIYYESDAISHASYLEHPRCSLISACINYIEPWGAYCRQDQLVATFGGIPKATVKSRAHSMQLQYSRIVGYMVTCYKHPILNGAARHQGTA